MLICDTYVFEHGLVSQIDRLHSLLRRHEELPYMPIALSGRDRSVSARRDAAC